MEFSLPKSPHCNRSRLKQPNTMVPWLISALSMCAFITCALAQTFTNHTVDGGEISGAIGSWRGQWDLYESELDYGGTHFASNGSDARLIFTFEGVAVYLIGPKFPDTLDCTVAVDWGEGHHVNMTNSSGNTLPYTTLWGISGLSNERHQLIVEKGTSENLYVDAFIYTSQSGVALPPLTTTISPIALGVAISTSVICIILLIFLFFILLRRRRRTNTQDTLVSFTYTTDNQNVPRPEKEVNLASRDHSDVRLPISKPPLVLPNEISRASAMQAREQPSRTTIPASNSLPATSSRKSRFSGAHVQQGGGERPAHPHIQQPVPIRAQPHVEESEPPPSYAPRRLPSSS